MHLSVKLLKGVLNSIMKVKFIFFILYSSMLLSCNKVKDETKNVIFFKKNIATEVKNIQITLEVLDAQKNGNPASAPYNELVNELNKILFSTIDTTFTNIDSAVVKKQFEKLNTLYHQRLQKSQQDPKSKLLQDDYESLMNQNFKYITYNEDLVLNYYLTLSQALKTHYQNIYLFGSCSSICRFGALTEELGYSLIINQKQDTASILFNQNYFRFNESIKITGLKSLLKYNKPIKTYNNSLIDKNTISIKSPSLDTGTYQLCLNIEMISSKYFKDIHSYNYKFKIK